ncbi:UDP-glucose:glycoprotein glucosyltransferase 1-like isoform X2 [Lineus longissimus]|uniref:UDP-glucose:glycoprotein glucosyltransferase 1-like isoform X2 n=1 Tax=Lineus longissimus TaxID=88925 RepID=UPI00315DE0D2
MATSMKMGNVVYIALVVFVTLSLVQAKTKYVTVSLDAKWMSAPLVLEASEFFAKESSEQFWKFVDAVSKHSQTEVYGEHDEEHYNFIKKVASEFLSPFKLKLFLFSLSLRAHSPAISMYHQVAGNVDHPDCETFVEVNGKFTCDVAEVDALLKENNELKTVVFKSDHHYPGVVNEDSVVILYGALGTTSFTAFHEELKKLASTGKIDYILRHYVKDIGDEKVRLSGYGVELAIKSQEYKAKDDTKVEDDKGKAHDANEDKDDDVQGFLFSRLKEMYPELKENLSEFRKFLVESSNEMAPLKVWQLQDLSFQAAQRVVSAAPKESLRVLRDISQNFPTQTRFLVKTTVKEEMRTEIQQNQRILESVYQVGTGESTLFINGLQIDFDIYDPFTLLDTLKSEARLLEGFHAIDIKGDHLQTMLSLEMKDSDVQYALDIRDQSVQYLNNLQKDKKYNSWPSSVQEFLRPTFPGMLRHIAKNIFHLVFMVDPAQKPSRELLKMAEAFYVHSAPIRIGVVVLSTDKDDIDGREDASVALYRAFTYYRKKDSAYKGVSFITDVYERAGSGEITPEVVVAEMLSEGLTDPEIKSILGPKSKYDKGRLEAVDFYKRTGLGSLPQVLMNGVPLKKEELTGDSFEEAVVGSIMKATPDIQKAVYNGKIYDGKDILEWLMSQKSVMPRLNNRVFNLDDAEYLDFTKNANPALLDRGTAFKKKSPAEMTGVLAGALRYITRRDDVYVRQMTYWVVGDLGTKSGRRLLYDAIRHSKSSNDARIGIVHNPTTFPKGAEKPLIATAVQVAIDTLPNNLAKMFITKLLKEENVVALVDGTRKIRDLEVNGMDIDKYEESLKQWTNDFLHSHRGFCEKALEIQPGERVVIANGRIIGPFRDDEEFSQEDFGVLEKHGSQLVASSVKDKVIEMSLNAHHSSDIVMKISSLLLSNPHSGSSRKNLNGLRGRHSAVDLPAPNEGPSFDIVAVVDPATREAQRMAPIILVLQEVVNANVKIYMNCREKLSEMPLKNFYRFVLEPEVTFKLEKTVTGPIATFSNLPHKPLLTMNFNPPQSWLVESVRTPYDLDNIYLEEIETGVNAHYELEYLLLEGHCYDTATGTPPRGLQFTLGTTKNPIMFDTIVMANLGYFQLKANPGAWTLRLREGRSKEIYDITSHEYTDSPSDSTDVIAMIDSFKSKIIKVKVTKKPEHIREDLLQTEDKNGGIWDSISRWVPGDSWWSKFTGGAKDEDKDNTLNIFSVASGHLYERFLRIMMLSVMKNTKSKVKFWFLKNYLSPSFKETIHLLQEKYDFEYELVQYKWPRWLHQQTEKQRIIWGYKILFFDVLFPLNVKKIIFVDADQIVRTDLQELYDLDLEGAPYGYTPFCDSRTEMDGFRFWKSGYWASHLGHRKYHISALYVVDLVKFRKIAAGDRLRGQYQGLSQDPNSLSNLDQDLPNNMIHQVAIKSLPQEWLWCETWCSDASKASAKTIDLCNNPQTKEPKLQAAMRIVPEWKDYDQEIKDILEKYGTSGDANTSQTSQSSKTSTDSEHVKPSIQNIKVSHGEKKDEL